jgi:hypothetical protein
MDWNGLAQQVGNEHDWTQCTILLSAKGHS